MISSEVLVDVSTTQNKNCLNDDVPQIYRLLKVSYYE